MVHDISVRQALDYLIKSQITRDEKEQQFLTAYRDFIARLIWVPLITNIKRAPLSRTPDEIVGRLSMVDPTVNEKVGQAFLTVEETIRDAVYFLLRAGFWNRGLCESFLQRGHDLTELFLDRTETFLNSEAGEAWSARKFFVAVAKTDPSVGDLRIMLNLPPTELVELLNAEQAET